jgi:hypothetical protein
LGYGKFAVETALYSWRHPQRQPDGVIYMQRHLSLLLLGTGVLVLSMAAPAQSSGQGPYYPQRDDPYYRNDPNYRSYPNRDGYYDDRYSQQRGYPNQGRYGNDRYGYGRNQDSLIERVLADLNIAEANARLDGHERKHFGEAARQLEQFEDRRARGKFDSGKIHEAIEELEHLVRSDRVNRRDREILARDMEDLRQFRYSRDRYSNGYGDYRDDSYNRNRGYNPNWR